MRHSSSCVVGIVQDSFKYLKSLKYLDLSHTNLVEFDACVFIQLFDLHVLQMERLSLNCSSCWLPIAKRHTRQLIGQCLFNGEVKPLESLTDRQLNDVCEKSSIDCSIDYCEPGSILSLNQSERILTNAKHSHSIPTKTIEILLGVIFGILILLILILIIIFFIRWKQGKKFFWCNWVRNRSSIAEATRRRRQQHKEIINSNPAVIESVVTHGANMNVSAHEYHHQETSNHKRKLYNPMFTDTSPGDNRYQQQQQQQKETSADDQITSHL